MIIILLKLLIFIFINVSFSGVNQSSLADKFDEITLTKNICFELLDKKYRVLINIKSDFNVDEHSFNTLQYTKEDYGIFKVILVDSENNSYVYFTNSIFCEDHANLFKLGLIAHEKLILLINIDHNVFVSKDRKQRLMILNGTIQSQSENIHQFIKPLDSVDKNELLEHVVTNYTSKDNSDILLDKNSKSSIDDVKEKKQAVEDLQEVDKSQSINDTLIDKLSMKSVHDIKEKLPHEKVYEGASLLQSVDEDATKINLMEKKKSTPADHFDSLLNKTLELTVNNSKFIKKIIIKKQGDLFDIKIETAVEIIVEKSFKLASHFQKNTLEVLSFITDGYAKPIFNVEFTLDNNDELLSYVKANAVIRLTDAKLSAISNDVVVNSDIMYQRFLTLFTTKFVAYKKLEKGKYLYNTDAVPVKLTCTDLLLRGFGLNILFDKLKTSHQNLINIKELFIVPNHDEISDLYSIYFYIYDSFKSFALNNTSIKCINNEDNLTLILTDHVSTKLAEIKVNNNSYLYRTATAFLIVKGAFKYKNIIVQHDIIEDIWGNLIRRSFTKLTMDEPKPLTNDSSFKDMLTNYGILMHLDGKSWNNIESIYISRGIDKLGSYKSIGIKKYGKEPSTEFFSLFFLSTNNNKFYLSIGEVIPSHLTLGETNYFELNSKPYIYADKNLVEIRVRQADLEPFNCDALTNISEFLFSFNNSHSKLFISRPKDESLKIYYKEDGKAHINIDYLTHASISCYRFNKEITGEKFDVHKNVAYKLEIAGKIELGSNYNPLNKSEKYTREFIFMESQAFVKFKTNELLEVIVK